MFAALRSVMRAGAGSPDFATTRRKEAGAAGAIQCRCDVRPDRALGDCFSGSPLPFAAFAALFLVTALPATDVGAREVTYTSYFSLATVFRDRDGDGDFDADGGDPSVQTNPDGSFVPPKGRGRLYLQGGTDIQSGKPNTLKLVAAPAVRSIGTLTSLWQALRDRGQKPARTRKLLGMKRSSLVHFSAVPPERANRKQAFLQRRDAQHDTLVKFLKALIQTPTVPRIALRATDVSATVRAPSRNDSAIQALADSMIDLRGKATDPARLAAVAPLLENGAKLLNLDLTPAEHSTSAEAATAINGGIEQNPEQLARLRTITDNAGTVLNIGDFFSLAKRYTGAGLGQQIGGALYIPKAKFQQVSEARDGGETDGVSNYPVSNGDGRYVAFQSEATNLVDGDSNGLSNVFLRDLTAATTRLISRAPNGAPGNGPSALGLTGTALRMTTDGRYVAYASEATNLVDGVDLSNGCGYPECHYLYVYDAVSGVNSLHSVDPVGRVPMGVQYFSMNADGRVLAFHGVAIDGSLSGTFVRDVVQGTTVQLPVPDSCVYPEVSPNGRFILCGGYFVHEAVLYDLQQAATIPLFALNGNFLEGSGGSSDYQQILYCTDASTVVSGADGGLFLLDRTASTNTLIDASQNTQGSCGGSMAPRSGYLAFSPALPTTIEGVTFSSGSLYLLNTQNRVLSALSANSVDNTVVVGTNTGHWPSFSDNGLNIVYSADKDVFLATGWWNFTGP